ncbi:MAG: CAP domain-containing protein [Mycobacterium sp.]
MTDKRIRRLESALSIPVAVGLVASSVGATASAAPGVPGNNDRLNNGIVVNVDTIKSQAGCTTKLLKNPQLQAAAQRHAVDVLNNRNIDADIGSDGSTVQDRARDAGYRGTVAETVAINNSLAINDLDVMGNWYYRPDYMAIMSNCANTQIGVWSENSFDRSVLVAVYGQPA